MIKKKWALAVGALMVCAQALGQGDASGEEELQEVWFDALFNEQGQVAELKPVDEASQPKGFWDQMLPRVKQARIPAPQTADGQPATFRTGMRITLAVRRNASGAGAVRLAGLSMLPVVMETYMGTYPADAANSPGWEGAFTAVCTVGIEGKCTKIDVKAIPGLPDSIRRYARNSLEGWRFKPQEVNGKPIEGEYVWRVQLSTLDNAPKNFLYPSKF